MSSVNSTNNNEQHLLQVKLLEQMLTAVVVLNKDLLIEYVNPAAEVLLIKSTQKLYQQPFCQQLEQAGNIVTQLNKLLTSGQEINFNEVTIQRYDQTWVTAELIASSIDFNNNEHILLEIKQIDQQKQISNEAFQQLQWESARDLIKGLAHEIKNPLGGLRGAAQLLSKELTTQQQEYTQMIIEQADRLSNLVDKLLGPNNLPNFKVHNIHRVLEKCLQLISLTTPEHIKIIKDYDPSIPELHLDDDKIQQALLNIINNAITVLANSSKNQSATITIKTRAASNQTINGKRIKLCLKLSIIDNGPGIPNKIKETLFYPMVSGSAQGTGLGLSISQTLIHQHQGKLSCLSRTGYTEFIILLPINEDTIS